MVATSGCASSRDTSDPLHPAVGPVSPAIGTAYPYDLYTHCGVRYAYFVERWWEADSPTSDDPSRGSNPYTGYVHGRMALVSALATKFDDPGVLTATFHPLSGQPQPCS